MASLGDSITAGTLSDISASEPFLGPPDSDGIRHPTDPSVPGVIFSIQNKNSYSWTSGRKIDSHYKRLKAALKNQGVEEKLNILNPSIPGEKASGIPAQIDAVIAELNNPGYKGLLYVTLFIGANDACRRTDNEQLRQQLRESYRALASIRQEERIKVLAPGLPAIPNLGKAEITEHRIPGSMTCREVREKVFGSCGYLIEWTNEAQYEQRMAEVVAKNRVIEEAARAAAEEFPNLDVHYSNAIFDTHIPAEFMAIDCFHPNAVGQSAISQALWNDQPWFR